MTYCRILKVYLKKKFLEKAQHSPEILTIHPFFALDFFPGVNDVPRVYADVFRLALELYLLQSLERFRGMLNDTSKNVQVVRWYHTLLQLEVASLGQKNGWQIQLELPYNNGTNNKSDVVLGREGRRIEVDATILRRSERGQKKRIYENWLTQMSIQFGVNIVGRMGEPWNAGKKEEQQWVQNMLNTLFSVSRSGLIAVVHSSNNGSLEVSRAAYGKIGIATIHDAAIQENIWNRIRAKLSEKNTQAAGHMVWLRMGEYAGVWHWSQYRDMTLEEKLKTLSLLFHAVLELFPYIAGVILSPGIMPIYYPQVQIPCTIYSDDDSIALRCILPGYCFRETLIIPREGMDEDARALAALYKHEDTWLDWALQCAGNPPFHMLVQ